MTTTINIMSYKYGHVAAQAIESVLSQTQKFDVVRFFDDGVGDCEYLKAIYPEVEFILRPKNLGIVPNFNDALERTETDRVMFIGADNWLRRDALEKLQEYQTDIVTYAIYLFGMIAKDFFETIQPQDREERDGELIWHMPHQSTYHGSSLYNVKKAKAVGGYEPSGGVKSEEDMVLFKKMMDAGATASYLAEPLLYYRRHRENFQK